MDWVARLRSQGGRAHNGRAAGLHSRLKRSALVLLAFSVLGLPLGVFGAGDAYAAATIATPVQLGGNSTTTGGSTISITGVNVTAGHSVFVLVAADQTTATVSVTDGVNGSYTLDRNHESANLGNAGAEVWIFSKIAAQPVTSGTITVTFSGATPAAQAVTGYTVAGVGTTPEAVNSAHAVSRTVNSGTVTPASTAQRLIIGATAVENSSTSAWADITGMTGGTRFGGTSATALDNMFISPQHKLSTVTTAQAAGTSNNALTNTANRDWSSAVAMYGLDTTAPSVSSSDRQTPSGTLTNADSVTFRVTFSEPVTGVTAGDFTATGTGGVTGTVGSPTAVAGSGSVYDVPVNSVLGDGTLRLDLNGGTDVTDSATNVATAFNSGQAYTLDNTAPTVSSINRLDADPTNADSVTYRVTFSETVTGVDDTDFELTATGAAGSIVNPVSAVSGTVYDVTVNNITGDGTLRLDLKSGTDVTDAATNVAAAFTGGETYTIDNTNPDSPAVTFPAASSTHNAASYLIGCLTLLVDDICGTAADNAGGSGLASVEVSIKRNSDDNYWNGTTFSGTTQTFNAATGTTNWTYGFTRPADGTYTIQVRATDNATNSTTNSTQTVTFDTGQPSVTSINRHNPAGADTNADSVVYRVTFSETVLGVDDTDFTLVTSGTSGDIESLSAVSGTTYDLTVDEITGDGTLGLNLNSSGTGITDIALNAISGGFTGQTYTIDNTAPTVTAINRKTPAGENTNADSVVFEVTFSESVSGIDTGDFTPTTTGGVIADVESVSSVSGSTVDVTVDNITGDGTLGLNLNSSGTGITDIALNAISGGFTGQTYTIDNTAPSVSTINRLDADPTNADSVDYRVTFSETVTGVTADDFEVTPTDSAVGDVDSVAPVSGTIYDVTVDNITGDGTLRLDFEDATDVGDAAGNLAAQFTTGQTYTIDNTAPTVTSINRKTPSATTTNADTVVFEVDFSESVSGIDVGDFTATTTGGVTADVESVSAASGTTVDVTVDEIDGDGTLGLESGTGMTDVVGNSIAAFTGSETYTIDNTAPTVTSINRLDGSPTNADEVDFRVTFDEPVSGVGTGDFTLTESGADGTITGVSAGTTIFDVTVGSITGDGTLRLDLNDSGTGITDAAGNVSDGFDTGEVYTIDNTNPDAPVVTFPAASATYNAAAYTAGCTALVDDLCGTAADNSGGSGLASVAVSIKRNSDDQYWDGDGFDTGTQTFNAATGTTTWSYDFNRPADGSYTIQVRALDNVGNSTTSSAQTVTFDTDAPEATSINRLDADPTNATSVVYRVTFSEAVTGVDDADFELATTGDATGAIVDPVDAVSSATYDVTVENISGNGTLGLNLKTSGTGISDAADNPISGGLTGQTYTIDNTNPDTPLVSFPAASDTYNATDYTSGCTAGVDDICGTAADNAGGTGLDSVAVSIKRNSDDQYWDGDGFDTGTQTFNAATGTTTWSYDFDRPADGTYTIQVRATDSATNATTSSTQTVTFDTQAPTVSTINRHSPAGASTNADSVTYRVTFSETVTGVTDDDFELTTPAGTAAGSIVSPVSVVSGTVYDVTVNGITGDGTLRLDFKAGTDVADAATNVAADFNTGEIYTIDNTNPTLSIGFPATNGDVFATDTEWKAGCSTPTLADICGTWSDGSSSLSATWTLERDSDNQFWSAAGTSWGASTDNVATVNTMPFDWRADLPFGAFEDDTEYTLTVTGSDPAGNQIVETRTFKVDTTGPDTSVDFPATDGDAFNSQSVWEAGCATAATGDICGDATDATTSVADVTWTLERDSDNQLWDATLETWGASIDNPTTLASGEWSAALPWTAIDDVDTTYTLTVTATDVAGNTTVVTRMFDTDTTAPTVSSIERAGGAAQNTNSTSVDFTVTFSEPVTGVGSADFSLLDSTTTLPTVDSVTGTGDTYTVTVDTGTGDGIVDLDLIDDDSIADAADNPLGGTGAGNGNFVIGETYSIDTTAPSVTSINRQTPAAATTNASAATWRVTFSESVSGVDTGDFELTKTSTADGTIDSVSSSSGTTIDVTVNSVTGDGTLRLDLKSSGTGITDADTNPISGGFTGGQIYTIDTTAPTVSSINRKTPSGQTTNAMSVVWRVTFSEAVSGVDTSDFSLTQVGGTTTGTIASVSSSAGTTIDVTVNSLANNGELRLDLNGSGTGIDDGATNAIAGGFTTGQTYIFDFTIVNGSPTATAQSVTTDIDTNKSITLGGTDPENDSLTWVITDLPTNGSLYDGPDTSGTLITAGALPYTVTDSSHRVTYEPATGFTGSDSFDFFVNDGLNDSTEATVTIDVNNTRIEQTFGPGGGSLTSIIDPFQGATFTEQVAARVEIPTEGTVVIERFSDADMSSPVGWNVLGSHIEIEVTDGAGDEIIFPADDPMIITLHVDAAAAGTTDASGLGVFKDGALVPDCASSGIPFVDPEPSCVASRSYDATMNDLVAVIWTRDASSWNGAVLRPRQRRPRPPRPKLTGVDPSTPANDNTPRITGTVPKDSKRVYLFADKNCKGRYVVAPASQFTDGGIEFTVPDDSVTTFHAKVSDGRLSLCSSSSVTYIEDSSPPSTPTAPDLSAVSDTGKSDHDDRTGDTTPTFVGTAEAGTKVAILADGVEIGRAAVVEGSPQSTTYEVTTDALPSGTHRITATAIDLAGNASKETDAIGVTIDDSVSLLNVVVNTEYISPNGDGRLDRLRVKATATEPLQWFLNVLTGEVNALSDDAEVGDGLNGVMPFTTTRVGTSSFTATWGGLWNERPAPDGRYSWALRGEDEFGNLMEPVNGTVTVDRVVPLIRSVRIAPSTIERRRGTATISFVVNEPSTAQVTVMREGTPVAVFYPDAGQARRPIRVKWNGTYAGGGAVEEGEYTIWIVVTDRAGNVTRQSSGTVTVR